MSPDWRAGVVPRRSGGSDAGHRPAWPGLGREPPPPLPSAPRAVSAGKPMRLRRFMRARHKRGSAAWPRGSFIRPACISTGAARPRQACPRPQTQGPMTATPPLLPGTDHTSCAGSAYAGVGTDGRARVLSSFEMPFTLQRLRPGPPLPSSRSRRARAAGAVSARAVHRSSGLNDQAHVVGCHQRGRNPRCGAGR